MPVVVAASRFDILKVRKGSAESHVHACLFPPRTFAGVPKPSSGLGSSRNKPAVHKSTQMQMRASGQAPRDAARTRPDAPDLSKLAIPPLPFMNRARRNRTARREPKSTPRKISCSNGSGMAGFEKRARRLHFRDATSTSTATQTPRQRRGQTGN